MIKVVVVSPNKQEYTSLGMVIKVEPSYKYNNVLDI